MSTPKARVISLSVFTPLLESGQGLHRSKATKDGHVFEGVTIIKTGLGNRRDRNYYPSHVLKEAADAGMFERLRAYADHPTSVDEEIQPERTVRDLVGVYSNTRFKEGGRDGGAVVGDLRILRAHKWLADVVDELIEIGAHDKIGLSINGRGATVPAKMRLEESGEEVDVNEVQKFIDLRSADVVTEAGAGGGFPQLLESVRGAAKETGMAKNSEILKQLQEAAAAGDLEKVKALTAQLAEAGLANFKGKKAAPFKKGKKAMAEAEPDEEEAEVEDEEEEVEEADSDEGEGEEVEDEDDEDVEESEDPEAELDEAVDGIKADAALDEEDEDEDLSEAEEEALDEACAGRKRKRMAEAKGPLAKGMPKGGGAGKLTKPAGGRKITARRFGESAAADLHTLRVENAQLRNRAEKLSVRNERLAEALRVHNKADAARKLLKESGIPPELRGDLVERLVRLPNEDAMVREIRFNQRLVESAAKRLRTEIEDYDEVEGAGTRIRESYGGEGGDAELTDLLTGLPLKK